MIETDVVIIGAGPVGLFAVFELGLLDLRCHLVDVLDRPGGQCAEFYPEKPIYDIPGIPRCTGQQLVDQLVEQIAPFHPGFHFSQMVTGLARDGERWLVETSEGTRLRAAVVVIAAGSGCFMPRRPPIPGIEAFEGRGVSYAVRRIEAHRDRQLVILGGGDSALDWVLNLQPVAARVTLVHRRAEFRAAPDSLRRVLALAEKSEIDFLLGECVAIEGTEGNVSGARIRMNDGMYHDVRADDVLPFFGLSVKLGPIADWGINLQENRIAVDTEKFETSVPGLFAVGDINAYPGKLKLILSGFHETALMAQQAFRYCRPDKRLLFQYTTTSTALQKKFAA